MRSILKHLISIIIAIIIVLLIQAFIITGTVIKNDAMEPSLKLGDRVIIK